MIRNIMYGKVRCENWVLCIHVEVWLRSKVDIFMGISSILCEFMGGGGGSSKGDERAVWRTKGYLDEGWPTFVGKASFLGPWWVSQITKPGLWVLAPAESGSLSDSNGKSSNLAVARWSSCGSGENTGNTWLWEGISFTRGSVCSKGGVGKLSHLGGSEIRKQVCGVLADTRVLKWRTARKMASKPCPIWHAVTRVIKWIRVDCVNFLLTWQWEFSLPRISEVLGRNMSGSKADVVVGSPRKKFFHGGIPDKNTGLLVLGKGYLSGPTGKS